MKTVLGFFRLDALCLIFSVSAAKCEAFRFEESTVVHRCQDVPNGILCILLFSVSPAL